MDSWLAVAAYLRRLTDAGQIRWVPLDLPDAAGWRSGPINAVAARGVAGAPRFTVEVAVSHDPARPAWVARAMRDGHETSRIDATTAGWDVAADIAHLLAELQRQHPDVT